MKPKLQVFFSYSHRDTEAARALARALQKAGLSVWDGQQIAAGSNFAKTISQALERSNAMVLMLSPEYLASPWNKLEWQYALSNPRFENRLVPVLVKPSRDVPWILREFGWIDATKNTRLAATQVVKALKQGLRLPSLARKAS